MYAYPMYTNSILVKAKEREGEGEWRWERVGDKEDTCKYVNIKIFDKNREKKLKSKP